MQTYTMGAAMLVLGLVATIGAAAHETKGTA